MSTGPYLADTPEVLAQSHGHIVRGSLQLPAVDPVDLVLTRAADAQLSVTFDEARAPRATAQLTCPIPAAPVDPKAGVRLVLDVGYRRPDGREDVAAFVDLGVRRARRDHVNDRLTLQGAGDEALMIDASPAVAGTVTGATSAAAAESLIVASVYPRPPFTSSIAGPAVSIDPVPDRWAAAQDVADRAGAQLYDDGLRAWHFDPTSNTLATDPDLVLTIGQGGTILEPTDELDRDDWHNYVQLVYRWRTAAGADAQVVGTAYATDGPYAITGPAGRRILQDARTVATTQAEANAAAKAVLARQLARGDRLNLRAIAAYWLRPGHTVQVGMPGGVTVRQLVSRVTFYPLDGTMSVETRAAVDPASITAAATSTPPSSSPTPDPTPVSKLRYCTVWTASSTATYRGDGTKRADVDAGDLWQGGYPGGYNGDQRSLALFTGANSQPQTGQRGETGKTITQALAGVPAGDIESVQVFATAEHWWGQDGTALVGWLRGTTAPATAPAMYVSRRSEDWPRNSRRNVYLTASDLAAALVNGTCRGVTFGPAGSLNTTYYGRLSAIQLLIIYRK